MRSSFLQVEARRFLPTVTGVIVLCSAHPSAVDAQSQSPIQDPSLRAYVEQVDREWPGELHQQSITSVSLTLFADAVRSVAERERLSSPEIADRIDQLRKDTRTYAAGAPGDPEQGGQLRRTFFTASDLVRRLVAAAGLEKQPVDAQLSALQRSAESLDPNQPLRRQPDVIERFFHLAAEALRRVEEARTITRQVLPIDDAPTASASFESTATRL